LALEILRDQKGLTCLFRYDPFLFDTAHVQRMAENFEKLLQEALHHPAEAIGRLALLSEDEYQQIVYDWNNTALDLSPIQPLHWVFEQQVERTPEHIALIYEENSRSYRALNALANQLAHHLRKLGIQRDVPVALFMGRSIELIVVILATLKAGGAFVLIDPIYPTDRVVFMLNDTDAPVIITSTVHQSQLPGELTRHVIVLDAAHQTLADYPVTNPTPVNAPDDLVWIPYTSGTTGRPKGVLLTHRGVHNYFFGRSKLYQFSPADTTLTASAVSFDAIFKEIFNPLLNGSKMVILRHGWEGDLGFRQDVSHQHQVTWMRSTPSYWMAFLQHADPQKLSSLRFIELSGEAVTPKLRQQHYDVLPHVMLINAYGPAEACNNVSLENALLPAKRSTIGYPIANTRLYILDLRLNPLPIGVSGMLYLGGTGLARGYLNLPDLTAQRFIMHPVFGRLYQTGDLARRLADGNIEFMGRSDFQVKLRGIRIELAEIESILVAHPKVREAVVIVHEDELGEKRLAAYVTGDAEINSLRELVGEKVPDYMIPSSFVVIAAIPLTRNGKLDRRALPKPEYVNDAASFVAPRTATEQQIATLFRDLLHTDSIGIHSNFIHLGGHSLLGTRLIMRINQTFGVTLALRALFETPTVGGLARRVEGLIDAPAADDREHIRL